MTSNTHFGDLRERCQSLSSTEDVNAIAALLNDSYTDAPEQTCAELLPYALKALNQKPSIKPSSIYDDTLGPLLARATLDELLDISDDALHYGCRIQQQQTSRGATYYREYPRLDEHHRLPKEALLPPRDPVKDQYVDNKNTCIEALRMNAAMRLLRDKRAGTLHEREAWLKKQRKSKRWGPIINAMRIQLLGFELQIHDGLWPDELDFIEGVIRTALPEAMRTFYQLVGRTFILNHGGNHPISPFDWTHHRKMVCIMEESQGEFEWYVWLNDPAKNPKVYTTADFDGYSPSPELVRARLIHDAHHYQNTGHRFSTFWTAY